MSAASHFRSDYMRRRRLVVVDGPDLGLLPETAGLRGVRHHIYLYAVWPPEFAKHALQL